MNNFCQDHGIVHQVTAPYTPQFNGISERKNQTLMDMLNAMLLSSGAPEICGGSSSVSLLHIK